MDVKLVKLNDDAIIPKYGTEFSAGADLYNLPSGKAEIGPGETKLFHTGIALEIPCGYVGLIFARSGLATKRGLAPSNKVGVIDSDYRGEIMVSLHNHSDKVETVDGGERIAQLCILPYFKADFCISDELSDTDRGNGGFGSTGRK